MATNSTNMLLRIWNALSDPFSHDELEANWNKVDTHDHSTGKGVQISTGGIADFAITSIKMDSEAVAIANLASDVSLRLLPPAVMVPYPGTAAPGGWAMCDGASVLRAGAYADIFAVIGTTYGSVDGTHFTLPDMKGRTAVGADPGHVRLLNHELLGNYGGLERVTLTAGELPAHAHFLTTAGGSYVFAAVNGWELVLNGGAGGTYRLANQNPSGATSNINQTSNPTGATGASHENMPPYAALNWIIKL